MIKINTLLLTVFLLLAGASEALTQDKRQVDNVTAKVYMQRNENLKEVKERAFQKAKVNALRKAGISEGISSWKMQYTQQKGDKVKQSFVESISSEMNGDILSYDTVNQRKYLENIEGKQSDKLVYKVTIDATVIEYETATDPAFNIKIDDFKKAYEVGDSITFTVKPSKDCYLTIFNRTLARDLLIYPNQYEDYQKLKAGKSYQFPIEGGDITYTADVPEGKESEANTFFFVFTKEPLKFIKYEEKTVKEDGEDLMLKTIPNEQKMLEAIKEVPRKDRKVKVRQFKIFRPN